MSELFALRPDGRKLVVESEVDGKKEEKYIDLPEVEFSGIHKKFRDRHREALNAIYGFGKELAASGRIVPLTREEIMKMGIEKGTLKDLEEFKMIESHLVELKGNGINLGGRKVIVISPEGRSVVKFFSDAVSELLSSAGPTPSDLQTGL